MPLLQQGKPFHWHDFKNRVSEPKYISKQQNIGFTVFLSKSQDHAVPKYDELITQHKVE